MTSLASIFVLLVFAVALASTLAAQERQPAAKGKKEPVAESADAVARVAKDMQVAEDRLKKADPGDVTRKIQRNIIDGLDELIKQNTKSPSSGGGGASKSGKTQSGRSSRKTPSAKSDSGNEMGSAQDQQQGGKKSKDGPDDKLGKPHGGKDQGPKTEDKDKGKGDGKDAKEGEGKTGGAKDKGKDDDKGQAKGKEPGKDGGPGGLASMKTDKSKTNLTAELYRNDWGHLPLMKRLEMDAYSKERFMLRYDEVLRQYYRTIAEQGQKKDDER